MPVFFAVLLLENDKKILLLSKISHVDSFRRPTATKPNMAEPNSAAGTGTGVRSFAIISSLNPVKEIMKSSPVPKSIRDLTSTNQSVPSLTPKIKLSESVRVADPRSVLTPLVGSVLIALIK